MYFERASVFKHFYYVRTGRAANDRVVDHYYALAFDGGRKSVEFDVYRGFAFGLSMLNECSARISVADKTFAVRNSASYRIALRKIETGVGHAHDHIRFYGRGFCEKFPRLYASVVNGHAVDDRIGAGKINIFEYA